MLAVATSEKVGMAGGMEGAKIIFL